MIVRVNPQYNPELVDDINSSTKIGPGITLAKFLGSIGSKTHFDKLYSDNFFGSADRRQIARNLVIHSHIMQTVTTNSFFSRHRLIVTEGIYEPNPKFEIIEVQASSESGARKIALDNNGTFGKSNDGWIVRVPKYIGEFPTQGSINDLRRTGRVIIYQLVDIKGKSDPKLSFDLAVYIKDYCDYDKLTLDYDTFDPEGSLTCSIILETPKVPDTWNVSFKRNIQTTYNGELQAKNELLEILPENDKGFDFFS